MERVDFYILSERAQGNRYTLACRLIEKAWQSKNRIYVHTQDQQIGRHMDRLLWTFREGSFIPHGILGDCDPLINPVLLGWSGEIPAERQVLVNLGNDVPAFYDRFERVAEFIDSEPAVREAGRVRYRFYKEQGCPLQDHRIEA